MSSLLAFIAILAMFALPCSIIAIIVYKIKIWKLTRQNSDSYQENELYSLYKKRKKISKIIAVISIPIFFISLGIRDSYNNEEYSKRMLAKIEQMDEADKSIYEIKYKEFMQESSDESIAQKKAVQFVEKNHDNIDRVGELSADDKKRFEAKYAVFINNMSDFEARDKALAEMDEEDKQVAEELQKKYDNQAQYEEWIAWKEQKAKEQEAEELQKKYDDQAQYEEWIAWKKEQEAKELQKKYDDQAQYEEWIAWQKSEAEKNSPENKILNAVGKDNVSITPLGDGSYNVTVTRAAHLRKQGDEFRYLSTDEGMIQRSNVVYQCMEITKKLVDTGVDINYITINLTGRVTDSDGYVTTDNIAICELSGKNLSSNMVNLEDPNYFIKIVNRFWTVNGL